MREAQDAFLGILSLNPKDQDALHGLVVIRRQLARNDPDMLWRQAAEYQDAIRRGVETEEHYTLPAMEALVAASLQAVQEIEANTKPTSRPLRKPAEAKTPPPGPLAEEEVPSSSGKLPPPASHAAKPIGPQAPLPPDATPLPSVTHSTKPAGPQAPEPTRGPVPKTADKPPAAPTLRTPPSPPALAPKTSAPPATAAPKTSPPPLAAAPPKTSPPPAAAAPKTSPAPAASSPQKSPTPVASSPQTSPPTASSAATWGISPQTSPPTAASAATWGISPQTSPPAASAPQISPPPTDPNRLYMVRVGPVSDSDRAAALARQLVAGGFSQTKVNTQTGYRVVSEPLPRSVAVGLTATLAGRGIHSQVEPLGSDTVQLVFGTFSSQKEAETLAQRISGAGYDAWVREGAIYTLQLGPYPQSSVNTITGIIKSGAPGAAITAVPVP